MQWEGIQYVEYRRHWCTRYVGTLGRQFVIIIIISSSSSIYLFILSLLSYAVVTQIIVQQIMDSAGLSGHAI